MRIMQLTTAIVYAKLHAPLILLIEEYCCLFHSLSMLRGHHRQSRMRSSDVVL